MLNPNELDYKKLGFHAGLEVHHQIISPDNRKLFCYCKPNLVTNNTDPDYRFERYFRPVLGEMGDFDPGMLIEYEKGYRCIYNAYESCDCIYEQDEMPPHWPDLSAIKQGYKLAHWFDMSALIDEIIFARKQYLDGSITTGFQRTTIVGRDGALKLDGKTVKITNITVEEDSARKIKTENNGRTVYYNLDRLGVPLVEVITDHMDVDTPDELERVARLIGMTLRISGIGKRGIGAARQDVNISIAGGDRVELKGVQDLSLFKNWCDNEILRQDMLIKIAQELHYRHLEKSELEHTYLDLTEHFPNIPEKGIIMGIRLPKLVGIFGYEVQPGKDFGIDCLEKVALITGVTLSQMFFSHEFSEQCLRRKQETASENYFFNNITPNIDKNIRKALQIRDNDAYFLALGSQKWAIHAVKKVIERAKMALDGVPQETRRATLDGNSEFLRVIHGKGRLYPDTDTPMIDMDMDEINALKSEVGKRPWDIITEYSTQYGFSFHKVENMIRHDVLEDFEDLVGNYKLDANRVYQFLEETLIALRRENLDIQKLAKIDIVQILKSAEDGEYDYSVIPKIAKKKIEEPQKSFDQILSELEIKPSESIDLDALYESSLQDYAAFLISKNDIKQAVLKKLPNYKKNQIIGIIMRKVNGSISGKAVSDFVSTKMEALGE